MENSMRKNIGFCIKNTCNIVDLVTCLIQENVLTNEERQGIMASANNYAKVWELYELLIRKDEKHRKPIKRALNFSGNSLISSKLEEDVENSLWRVKYPRIDDLKMTSSSVQISGKSEQMALLRDIAPDIEKSIIVLHLKWVEADTVQLIDTLGKCNRLSFLHLENVKMNGDLPKPKRVCLPNLKDFVFNDDEDFVRFFEETNIECREARLRCKVIIFRTHEDAVVVANGVNDKFSDCKCNIFVSICSLTIIKVNRLAQLFHIDMVAQNHFILEGNEEKPEISFVELPQHLKPSLITRISIKFTVGIDAFSFPSAVSQCINLRSLELVMVKIVGRFIGRAYLPKLQEFYYDDLTDCSDDLEGRKQLEEYLKTTQIKSILFFNKSLDEPWNISDIWSLHVNINVVIKGVTLIRIDHNLRELVCGMEHANEADKILRGVPSNLNKLSLRDCVIAEDHVPHGLQELILFRVEGQNNDLPGLVKSCSKLTHLSLYTTRWIDVNFLDLPKTLLSLALFNVYLNSGAEPVEDTSSFEIENALLVDCDICKTLFAKKPFRDFYSTDSVHITKGKFVTLPVLRTAFRFYKFWSNESFEGRSHEPLTFRERTMAVDAPKSPSSPSPPVSDISDSDPPSEPEGEVQNN